jgi:hypothetical protein
MDLAALVTQNLAANAGRFILTAICCWDAAVLCGFAPAALCMSPVSPPYLCKIVQQHGSNSKVLYQASLTTDSALSKSRTATSERKSHAEL